MSALFGLIAFFGLVGVIYPTPLHRKVKITSRWISLAVFVVAAIISGATASSDAPSDNAQTATTTESKKKDQPADAKPAEPAKKEYGVGEMVKVGYLSFKVVEVKEVKSVKDPMGTEHKPGDGAKYVQLKITIQNNDKDQITADSNLMALVEKDGTKYDADPANAIWVNPAGESFFLQPINPKMSKTSNVLFAVPESVKLDDLRLEVQGGFLSSDKEQIKLK